MPIASMTEFRNNASQLMNLVEKGYTLVLTKRGKALVEIKPWNSISGLDNTERKKLKEKSE